MALNESLPAQTARPDHTVHAHPAKNAMEVAIQEERAFVVSDRVPDLGNGESHFLFIDSDGDHDLHVYLAVEATGVADLDISFGATENTAGADANVNNLKSDSDREPDFAARRTDPDETGDYSHGTNILANVAPANEAHHVLGARFGAPSFTIDSGDDKLFELINRSGGGGRFAYDVAVVELDL